MPNQAPEPPYKIGENVRISPGAVQSLVEEFAMILPQGRYQHPDGTQSEYALDLFNLTHNCREARALLYSDVEQWLKQRFFGVSFRLSLKNGVFLAPEISDSISFAFDMARMFNGKHTTRMDLVRAIDGRVLPEPYERTMLGSRENVILAVANAVSGKEFQAMAAVCSQQGATLKGIIVLATQNENALRIARELVGSDNVYSFVNFSWQQYEEWPFSKKISVQFPLKVSGPFMAVLTGGGKAV